MNKEIDLAKSENSKECMICYYGFFNHGFNFQDYICHGCHDLTLLSVNINISDTAISTVKNVDYRLFNICKMVIVYRRLARNF